MVHGIIEKHNGHIRVYSRPGEGTRFDIYLPTTDRENDRVVLTTGQIPTGSEQILAVDDEVNVINICETMLTRLGYSVTRENNPMKALEVFRADPEMYDLVITDLAMPQMMGNDLAAEILKDRPDMPIICCTGYNESINNSNDEKGIFKNYLNKPFTLEKLAHIVRCTIDQGMNRPDN